MENRGALDPGQHRPLLNLKRNLLRGSISKLTEGPEGSVEVVLAQTVRKLASATARNSSQIINETDPLAAGAGCVLACVTKLCTQLLRRKPTQGW